MKPEHFLAQRPIDYSTIYIDMDSFFASVEQYYNPKLRNRPVGVATGNSMTSSIISASYSAKKAGVYTGTRVVEALRMCPDLQVVYGNNHDSYKRVHREIMHILHNTICYIGVRGIDEAYLKVPSYAQTKVQVFTLVKAIKDSLKNIYNEHINCSIGIASNIWLAKMAASSQKPNGIVCVLQTDIPSFYYQFGLCDLNGIGHRMAQQFYRVGINNPSELYRSSWSKLSKDIGVNGQKWYLRLRGYEVDELPIKDRKSLGHQVTITGTNITNLAKITTFSIKIAEVLGYRLRKNQLSARSIGIQLVSRSHKYFYYNHKKLPIFDSNKSIIRYSILLLKNHKEFNNISKITITLMDLTTSRQIQLLPTASQNLDSRISRAIDSLEERYGNKVLSVASSFFENSFSLDRVGFATEEKRSNY